MSSTLRGGGKTQAPPPPPPTQLPSDNDDDDNGEGSGRRKRQSPCGFQSCACVYFIPTSETNNAKITGTRRKKSRAHICSNCGHSAMYHAGCSFSFTSKGRICPSNGIIKDGSARREDTTQQRTLAVTSSFPA